MTGTVFTEAAYKKATKLYTERVASFVFDVSRLNGKGKTHRVMSDVVLYAYGAGDLSSSFASCTCSRGMSCADRVCTCEHVLAVYMAVAGITEGDEDDGREADRDGAEEHPGGGPSANQWGTTG